MNLKYFRMNVRLFLAVLAGIVMFPENSAASNVGKRYPSEKHIIVDQVTGRMITVLTSSQFNDSKPYQTNTTWTSDGNWIVFRSARGGNGSQIFVVNELTGDIVQLTDNKDVQTGDINLSRKEMKMFYIRGQKGKQQIIELNIGRLIADSMSDQVKEQAVYERTVAPAPEAPFGTCLTLDADETFLYWRGFLTRPELTVTQPEAPATNDRNAYAAYMEKMRAFFAEKGKGTSVIMKINIKTGKTDKVMDVSFHIGHLQANPWVPGEMFFCNETGGDAGQRIWSVKADGKDFRPIYVETPYEWVTHETVTAPDEMMFIINGNNIFLREKPSGIAVIDLRTNQMRLLGEVYGEDPSDGKKTGGFWHCNGSPDMRWAVGDTHYGNITLIHRATGEQILLSTGHPMIPDHAHPIFSPDSKRVLIQSALLTNGKNLNLMVLNVPYDNN